MSAVSQPDATAPLVSVVMATYNRSNILPLAIESVRWQTHTNWELWVIGDACTDDTADVVASIDDPRIHFHNLPVNNGEQSAPNNEGFRRARGQYLAILNHDDLWLPDHLQCALEAIDTLQADLVWPLALSWDGAFDCYGWRVNKKRRYTPELVVPASFWVFRRELVERVGYWQHYTECLGAPSQDWLFRAHLSKAAMYHLPRVTVVKSSSQPRSYADRLEQRHRRLFELARDNPRFREDAITEVMVRHVRAQRTDDSQTAIHGLSKICRRLIANARGQQVVITHKEFSPLVNNVLTRLGLNPVAVSYFVRFGRKGQILEHLRVKRGLSATPHSEN